MMERSNVDFRIVISQRDEVWWGEQTTAVSCEGRQRLDLCPNPSQLSGKVNGLKREKSALDDHLGEETPIALGEKW